MRVAAPTLEPPFRTGQRRSLSDAVAAPAARFGLLGALGFLLVLLETLRAGNEIFDFWEHAATVRQLMLHTSNPGNALLAIHTPSAFFSPYALLVALGAKLTGAGPVHALAAAGLVNYCLLLAGIWSLTRVFSDQPQAPFYALLFVWLLWGISPWKYSGFFNLRALSAVIAYPSTFATAIGLLTAGRWHRIRGEAWREQWLAGVLTALGLAVVVLTHPVAGAATAAALLAITLTGPRREHRLLVLATAAATAALLCVVWPYYSLLHLFQDQGIYDPSNSLMYAAWVERIFPILIALILFFYRTGTLRRARLAVYLAPLVALYIYGDVSRHYGEGRVISYVVIGAQIGLADLAAALERTALARLRGRLRVLAAAAVAILGVAELYNMRGGLRASLPGTGSAPTVYATYRDAVDGLPPSATIAAPLNDGAEAAIPVYAGRLIATHRPLAFVGDQKQRQAIVYTFFSLQASIAYRRQILARYRVRYIVVPATQPALLQQLLGLGSVIRRRGGFDTLAVRR